MKKILIKQRSDTPHWVGDGFPARSVFNYNELGRAMSPFLIMDYLGPTSFPPSTQRRGVGEHPHRGFETVSIIYSGEVEHRDSSGGGGIIRPGDVQWMTAASGLVHEEFHGKEYMQKGGPFEGIQLWVNLPKKFKMTKPRYQGIKSKSIPVIQLSTGAGSVRIIAGSFSGQKGPAVTFTPVNLWDIHLNSGKQAEFIVPPGHTAAVFVRRGSVTLGDGQEIGDAEMALLERDGDAFVLKAQSDADILFMGGEPIEEPIFGIGPFVMNTSAEIAHAMQDFESGKMGVLGEIEGSEYHDNREDKEGSKYDQD